MDEGNQGTERLSNFPQSHSNYIGEMEFEPRKSVFKGQSIHHFAIKCCYYPHFTDEEQGLLPSPDSIVLYEVYPSLSLLPFFL